MRPGEDNWWCLRVREYVRDPQGITTATHAAQGSGNSIELLFHERGMAVAGGF